MNIVQPFSKHLHPTDSEPQTGEEAADRDPQTGQEAADREPQTEEAAEREPQTGQEAAAVSYTHLTLPTRR